MLLGTTTHYNSFIPSNYHYGGYWHSIMNTVTGCQCGYVVNSERQASSSVIIGWSAIARQNSERLFSVGPNHLPLLHRLLLLQCSCPLHVRDERTDSSSKPTREHSNSAFYQLNMNSSKVTNFATNGKTINNFLLVYMVFNIHYHILHLFRDIVDYWSYFCCCQAVCPYSTHLFWVNP